MSVEHLSFEKKNLSVWSTRGSESSVDPINFAHLNILALTLSPLVPSIAVQNQSLKIGQNEH